MSNVSTLKSRLIQHLQEDLQSRIVSATADLHEMKEARDNETKSSAGDKYETGRAMVAIEMEKLSNQINQMQDSLAKLEFDGDSSTLVGDGSLVVTSQGIFLISIGLGRVTFSGQDFFVISSTSPIGELLSGKKVGDHFEFRNKKYLVEEIQ